MNLIVENQHNKYSLDKDAARKLIVYLQKQEEVDVDQISIIISTDEHLNQLKNEFYNQDVLTDTISFNLNEDIEPVEGEIYMSADRIEANAYQYDNTLEYEFANVLIHSILHTFGYEDETESKQEKMFNLQKKYLNSFNYNQLLNKEK